MTVAILLPLLAVWLLVSIGRDRIRIRLSGPEGGSLRRWRVAHEREALAGLAAGAALDGVAGAWLGLASGVVLGELRQRRAPARHARELEAQTPELIRALIASLRSGGDILGALREAERTCADPMASLLRRMLSKVGSGVGLVSALDDMTAEGSSPSLTRVIDALILAHEVGGEVIPMLSLIGEQVRDAAEIDRQRRAATSQGRMSALVVGAMPIAFLAMTGSSPRSPSRILLTEPVGWSMLAIGLLLEVAGFLWVRKLVAG